MRHHLIEAFDRYDADNPHVYELVKEFTFEAIAAGFREFAIQSVIERIRWRTQIETYSEDGFKIANAHAAFYARKFMVEFPQHVGFFRLVACVADQRFKVEHVRKARQTRDHECHWPGCGKQVPPAAWGCKRHWFMLPKEIRDRIWRAYRAGQEEDLKPSTDYFAAARAAQEWIANESPL